MRIFWNFCLSQFEQELPPQQFSIWIRPLRLEDEDSLDKELRLVAPKDSILKCVKERYLGRIEEFGQQYFSAPIRVSLSVGTSQTARTTQTEISKPAPSVNAPLVNYSGVSGTPVAKGSPTHAYEKTRLIQGFAFDNLIVGKANDLARAASFHVATNPGGDAYNPMFIYGGTGLGKTHLIHAIGNRIVGQYPEKIIRYVHANDYYNSAALALQNGSIGAFRQYYQSLDVLLLDDVQFLKRKWSTQEELFFVFNTLVETKKQIVITCDTYPKNIAELEDRLVTRFDWGLTVQIEPPEIEMRVAILMKKAEVQGIALDDGVAFYIAKYLRSNVRELEGALKKVLAYAFFNKRQIDLELTKEALKDVIGTVNHQITVENIQKTVADYFRIKIGDLFSKNRTRPIVRPRQVAMWLSKNLTSQSYPSIGEAFGGRDHTTVLHAVRTIDTLREKDRELNHHVHVLLQVLKKDSYDEDGV